MYVAKTMMKREFDYFYYQIFSKKIYNNHFRASFAFVFFLYFDNGTFLEKKIKIIVMVILIFFFKHFENDNTIF